MLLTILGVTCFQLFWLKQTYEQENKTLSLKTSAAFRDVIEQLQISKFTLDSLLPGRVKLRQFRLAGDDSIKQELTVALKEKKGMVSAINIISKKVKDSLIKSPGRPRKIIISKDRDFFDRQLEWNDSLVKDLPEHDGLFNMLYGVDSLQQPLTTGEIDTVLRKQFKKQNITVPFSVEKVDVSIDSAHSPNIVSIGFVHPSNYFLKLGNKFPYLLKQMITPILLSVLLLGIMIISFLLLYKNLLQQKRLTAIKNEFIGNITHELKTPLATVSVAIEAMKNFNALQNPERTKEYLDISSNELQRLSLLVDRVLSLSKYEKNEIKIKKENFDLVQLIGEVIDSMKLQFAKQGAIVTFHKTADNFIIDADRHHISSVIYNLLDNALKYSNADPRISVQLIDHSQYFELKVTDNGIGIPAEYNKKIFEQFFRVPTGDTHNIKGYGLGLSYVNYIVKNHQGFVEVESELDKGSTFIIKLPFKEAIMQNDKNQRS